ncbi:sensor histidine kinase [Pontibacter liquoris]|uniref:sensor histidine kinase n=1 Tax=Pontibacter liquoris TaxID=2905677 RepID=UPI001FA6EE5D|nr:ATP-binding protein [Pontibacter liquoris]
MSDTLLIIAVGTTLLLLLGLFIAFMTLAYQQKRLQHQEEVTGLVTAYQKEILKAQLEMQEQTFLSISQEIHDNVGQILSLVRLHISTLGTGMPTGSDQKIQSSKVLLDQAIADLRDLSKRLNSNYVSQQSLATLLRFQLELIGKTGVVATHLEVTGEEGPLHPEKKLILFRIAQEAINNTLRHAGADTLTARLVFSARKLALHLADNGKGLPAPDPASPTQGLRGTGMQNMYYRAELIGATLRIQGPPGEGTRLALELPLN